jgi:hypothetical protein
MAMRIGKTQIVEMFRVRGQHERAQAADTSLPEVVDTRADAELLTRHGIDPREMVNRLPDTTEH